MRVCVRVCGGGGEGVGVAGWLGGCVCVFCRAHHCGEFIQIACIRLSI